MKNTTITTAQYRKFAHNPAEFRDSLIVDVSGEARSFDECQDDWQRLDFEALDAALMSCTGNATEEYLSDYPEGVRMRAYLERPRGHSKTTDLGVICCWALAFAQRPIKGYAYAADKDQARLLRDAMFTLVRLNPWLSSLLNVTFHCIENIAPGHPGEGGTLTIEASNVGSSYGILPDLIIADELTHWQGDGELWNSLLSSAAKRENCLFVVISNAGFMDSWQWECREAARANEEDWYFSRLEGPQASWLTPKRLEEQRKMLPGVAYARLWLNQWSSGGGDALLPEDIEAAFHDDLREMTGRERGWYYAAGVDLGLTRDCSAVVVLAVPKGGISGKIRLAHTKLWRPYAGKKIILAEVEDHILALDAQFGLEYVAFDPWNCAHLAQRLETDTRHVRRNQRRLYYSQPWMREISPTGSNLQEQASLLIESFTDRRLRLYDCESLKRDLLRLRVEERNYGFRLTSPRDADGHGDTASAFALALLMVHELAGKTQRWVGGISSSNPLNSIPGGAYSSSYAASEGEDEEDTARRLRVMIGHRR